MNANEVTIEVQHNAALQRFEAQLDGKLCVAEYERRHGDLVFTHTFVPPELRGHGIAEKLVRTALEYAREQHARVVPECSYVAAFIQRHREFAPLTA